MKLKQKVKELKVYIPAIYLALKDKETKVIAKVLAWVTIGYALSPIDLIPDFIPVIGYLDDLLLLPLLIRITIQFIPKDKLEEYKVQAQLMWESGRPKKWGFVFPILAIWGLILYVLIRWILSL